MKQITGTITEPELDAVFDALLVQAEDRPALDVASMTQAETRAKLAELKTALTEGPSLAENAVRLACSYTSDDATISACVRRFLAKIDRRMEWIAADVLAGGAA